MNSSVPSPKSKKGLIHFYYGMGSGKTSAAIGHIVRVLGRNLKPILVQFLKKHDPENKQGFYYGEYVTLSQILKVPIVQFGDFGFIRSKDQIETQKKNAIEGIQKVKEILSGNVYDLVIFDEIGSMIKLGLFKIDEILKLLSNKSDRIEVILTGHEEILPFNDIADYVTFFKKIKHPYDLGIKARAGIEY